MLQEQITQYTAEINAFDTTNADELEQFRIRFLGTKGIIKDIFDEFKAVSPEEKRTLGIKIGLEKAQRNHPLCAFSFISFSKKSKAYS